MSARKIDHTAEAIRNIDGLHDYQSEEGMTDESMLTVAVEAQAHATLALVEQQRIANLLTVRERLVKLGTTAAYLRLEKVDALVEEGLGLA